VCCGQKYRHASLEFIVGNSEMKDMSNDKQHSGTVNKKTILLVVRWPAGGIRTFMRYVYRRFPVESYRFILVAPDYEETSVLLDDLADLDLTYYPVSDDPSPMELVREASRHMFSESIDLVHSHGFTSGICVAIPAILARVPHLLTIHETLNHRQFSGWLGLIKRLTMEFILSQVGTIQSVSYDAQANLLEFFPSLVRRGLVIHNGIDVEQFQKAVPRDLKGELGLGEDCYLIGFLGRFMSPKGFIHLVDAVALLAENQSMRKKLLVISFGDGGFIREEQAALKERGLDSFFRFLPFTPNVADAIKGLDLVAMPSLWEACPLLPMEVLTCGTPLIASNCIGLREVVQGTPTLVVPVGDSKALSESIRLCMEQDQRQRFSEFAPLAAQRYDVKVTAAKLIDLIKDKSN
jgi:glycosyltransferase involved in cell wall biosynthesis